MSWPKRTPVLNRGEYITSAVRVVEFVSAPAWRSYDDLAAHMNTHVKTARRWVTALEDAGVPIEFTNGGGVGARFRRMR